MAGAWLWLLPSSLVLLLLILPLLAGLLWTILPAFGYFPALGLQRLSWQPWQQLFAAPGFFSAVRATLISTALSTLLALLWAMLLLAFAWQSRALLWLQRALATVLSVPHAAFAVGLLLLLAPSGWLARLFSPWLTGWQAPPLGSWVGDPWGLSLALGLALKEMPFLLFMSLSALSRLPVADSLRLGRSLGYDDSRIWRLLILPPLLPLLRLPILAVLAYGVSVVDMALILGPSAPPTLAVMLDRWLLHPDLWWRLPASSGALLLLLLAVAMMAAWWAVEIGWRVLAAGAAGRGVRTSRAPWLPRWLAASAWGLLLLTALLLLVLLIWSLAWRWPFSSPLPDSWSLRHWASAWQYLRGPLVQSAWLAAGSALLGLIWVVLCLEAQQQHPWARQSGSWLMALLFLPLLLPQMSFLFGVQWLMVLLNWDGYVVTVLWGHLLFVVPYLYLTLSGPYRAFNPRLYQQALLLSGSRWRALLGVKWPLLLRSFCYVFAIAFAVSIAQYLSTRYLGAGRVATLTTETVALASGGDRRPLAAYALLQWLLPALVFSLMLVLPWLAFRGRLGMQLRGRT